MKLKTIVIFGFIVVFVAILVPNITGSATLTPGVYDDFAKCLTDNGVKMYGAYWCPHCQNQKEMFGNSWQHINYVECSLPNRAGQTILCKQENIEGYPTWEFGDGSRQSGVLSISQLIQKTGCEI